MIAIDDTKQMRQFLISKMVAVSEGKIEIGQAKAVSNLAQQIYNTVKLEMQFASLKSDGMKRIEAVSFNSAPKTRSLRAA